MKNRNFNPWGRFLTCLTLLLICFVTISCGDDEDNDPVVEPVIVEPEPVVATFDGQYIGGWWSDAANGSSYNNIPASMTIAAGSSATEWVGQFFYTRNHTSCCSNNPNDGTISFTMMDSVITNFQYLGTIPNCAGNFQGEGVLNAQGTIIIQLTGNDCEGEHSGARIELSK
ncbi:MAG: hypothetical protein RIF33_19175 [Cyclobacteriaceae bacterium]